MEGYPVYTVKKGFVVVAVSLPGDVSVEEMPNDAKLYLLRGHEPHKGYGTIILWSAIVIIRGDNATVCGLDIKMKGAKFTKRHSGSIKRWLIGMGIKSASWERLSGDGFRSVKICKDTGIY